MNDHNKYFNFLNLLDLNNQTLLILLKTCWERHGEQHVEISSRRGNGDILVKSWNMKKGSRRKGASFILTMQVTRQPYMSLMQYNEISRGGGFNFKTKLSYLWFKRGDANTKYFHSPDKRKEKKIIYPQNSGRIGNGLRG
ncbi:hypothetical protein H5410_003043 [Solanum commersonii]|uniref:Uncharacterized protein n=1 Tax=Solanum commersonii TaxID=4109 RepID=A0A9J6B3L7_SOLCO|nr:hypothetical protein H5410_003043 [Solanum commersonii]